MGAEVGPLGSRRANHEATQQNTLESQVAKLAATDDGAGGTEKRFPNLRLAQPLKQFSSSWTASGAEPVSRFGFYGCSLPLLGRVRGWVGGVGQKRRDSPRAHPAHRGPSGASGVVREPDLCAQHHTVFSSDEDNDDRNELPLVS